MVVLKFSKSFLIALLPFCFSLHPSPVAAHSEWAPYQPSRNKRSMNINPENLIARKLQIQFSPGDGSTIGGTSEVQTNNIHQVLSKLPVPSQSALDTALNKANRVRIFEGGSLKGKPLTNTILLDSKDEKVRRELSKALKIDEDATSFCQQISLGGPTIELLHNNKRIAIITYHHDQVIRWEKQWRCDASLTYGRRLIDWFAENGVEGPKLVFEEGLKDKRRTSADLQKWMMSMPECLRPYWGLVVVPGMSDILIYSPLPDKLTHNSNAVMIKNNPRLAKISSILDTEFTDSQVKILALLQWYASGVGAWTGFPSYEELPAELLLQIPSQQIIEALQQKNVSEPEFDGAARYFASHLFRVSKPHDLDLLDPSLKDKLLKQCLKSDDMDKRNRAESAFNSPN